MCQSSYPALSAAVVGRRWVRGWIEEKYDKIAEVNRQISDLEEKIRDASPFFEVLQCCGGGRRDRSQGRSITECARSGVAAGRTGRGRVPRISDMHREVL